MSLTVQEYLRKKGGIGMIALLHDRPMTYTELESEIEITSSTITQRRDEAAELGLITVSLGEAEYGTKKVYHLTNMGEYLAERMATNGVISSYRKVRTLQHHLEEQRDDVIAWIDENPSQLLQFTAAVEDNIIRTDSTESDPYEDDIDLPNTDSGTESTGADVETGPDESQSRVEPTTESDSESNSETESSPKVIRPDKPAESSGDDTGNGEWETKTDADESQRQLTDSDIQDQLEETTSSKEDQPGSEDDE